MECYGLTDSELPVVRSAISIVPQSPDLFEGTIRDNIDPLGQSNDTEIWAALDQVGKTHDRQE